MSNEVLRRQFNDAEPIFKSMAKRCESLLRDLTVDLGIHDVYSRAKTLESFLGKADRTNEAGQPKYDYPLTQLEDMAGARCICYSITQVADVCKEIEQNFDVVERIDKAEELKRQGKLGYVSRHFIVKMDKRRLELPEYRQLVGIKCEIQVRTVFQHAWAEVEHRLQYKADTSNSELANRFLALAGMVQIADREFDALFAMNSVLSFDKNPLTEHVSDKDDKVIHETDAQTLDAEPEITHQLHLISVSAGYRPAELVRRGEIEKAISVYSELIATQPRQSWHYIGRARAFIIVGRLEDAKKDLEIIRNLNPEDARIPPIILSLEQNILNPVREAVL